MSTGEARRGGRHPWWAATGNSSKAPLRLCPRLPLVLASPRRAETPGPLADTSGVIGSARPRGADPLVDSVAPLHRLGGILEGCLLPVISRCLALSPRPLTERLVWHSAPIRTCALRTFRRGRAPQPIVLTPCRALGFALRPCGEVDQLLDDGQIRDMLFRDNRSPAAGGASRGYRGGTRGARRGRAGRGGPATPLRGEGSCRRPPAPRS